MVGIAVSRSSVQSSAIFARSEYAHVTSLKAVLQESAGLVPYGDYIVGWSGGVLSSENDFYDLVEAHVEKPLRVYVYSHDFDTLREVVLIPNRHWGGEGLLGCVFGYGLLHRIPQHEDHAPGSTPPELAEPDEEYEEQQFYVPADSHPDSYYSTSRLTEWQRFEEEERDRENFGTLTPAFEHGSVSTIPEEESQPSTSDEAEDSRATPHDTPRKPSTLVSSSSFKGSTLGMLNGSFDHDRLTAAISRKMSGTPSSVQVIPVVQNSDEEDDDRTSVAASTHGSLTSVD
ncbi:hypothetical protein D9758_002587 [Tetrapyrgos nigripes]|uniref:PDZ GRASP-type domain-containing protein n=1 Tax=Tetrapyrgos nigripes TaxID=182062 RepID=A0A8H5GQM7_9AGAR|nr:hypothetical protein D9758_002587 [Tetrapyrgos nigripes]